MLHDADELDRPVWGSLTGAWGPLSVSGRCGARRLPPDIGNFAAAPGAGPEAAEALAALIEPGGEVSLVEVAPPAPPPGIVAEHRPTVQMALNAPPPPPDPAVILRPLTPQDAPEMLALAEMTRPGPFRANTHRLGRFIGVRSEGRLIAMGGERMAVGAFREASGVCTAPEFRGRGLGRAILAALCADMRARGLTPFLHSYADNAGAIALYRKLGFEIRRDVTHAIWRRA